MKVTENPALLDQLAASYALGTLRGRARRRFEAMAQGSLAIRGRVLLWQERLASLTELQPEVAPSPNVWKRIENVLAAQQQEQRQAEPAPRIDPTLPALIAKLQRALGWWRGAGLAGGLATVAAVLVGVHFARESDRQGAQLAEAARSNAQLTAQLQAAPRIEYVAVLAGEQQPDASILVTFDPNNQRLTLKRVGGFQEASDKSLQLWALPPAGGPQSLGVLTGDQVVRLPASPTQIRDVPTLAITLEPRGGVPPGAPPSGAVVFKGQLLQTTL